MNSTAHSFRAPASQWFRGLWHVWRSGRKHRGNWLEPGQHVTSIVGSNVGLVEGGFTPRKRREIDDNTLTRMDVIVVASREQVFQDRRATSTTRSRTM